MYAVIGTATVDLLILGSELPADAGEDGFRASNLVFHQQPLMPLLGGNGANSAYVLATLGDPVSLYSAVGQDRFGEMLEDWLSARHVNLDGLTRSQTLATPTSTIILSDRDHQTVFHHIGATKEIALSEGQLNNLSKSQVLLLSSFPLLTGMRGRDFARALYTVHGQGGTTAVDIGPAIGEPVRTAELVPLLPHIDYLIANEHELTVCTGLADWEAAAAELIAAGTTHIVVKRGHIGSSVRGTNLSIDMPAFAVETKIPVGAGDAFNAGLLFGLREAWALDDSLRFANGLAALVVSAGRGVLSAPTVAEVNAFLARRL